MSNSLTRSDVQSVYEALLGRSPESEAIVQHYVSDLPDLKTLLLSVLGSDEFNARYRVPAEHDAIADQDLALLLRHQARSRPQHGFIVDFVGTRTSTRYVNVTENMSGACFDEIPVPGDWKASAIEWIGTLKAVEASESQFVAVELGAGWGPWVVASGHAAKRLGRAPIRLYPVEADPGKFQFLLDHLQNNEFQQHEYRAEQAIIGPQDGIAHYPIIDAVVDWGSAATFGGVSDPSKFIALKSITIETLIKDERLVDLLHCDIQGSELEVISRSINALNSKVRYMVIGTHGRSIEGGLIELLSGAGWILENEEASKLGCYSAPPPCLSDGTQVWRNTRL
jgi:FkbM family methyltransferase